VTHSHAHSLTYSNKTLPVSPFRRERMNVTFSILHSTQKKYIKQYNKTPEKKSKQNKTEMEGWSPDEDYTGLL